MIDTDKYEGHTPAPWEWPEEDSILLKGKYKNYIITGRHLSGDSIDKEVDAALIADAPLLLAEVIRLREWIKQAVDVWENCNHEDRTDWFNNFCEVMKE